MKNTIAYDVYTMERRVEEAVGLRVKARVLTSNRGIDFMFDCTEFFEQAHLETIKAVLEDDYEARKIAYYYSESRTSRLKLYLEFHHDVEVIVQIETNSLYQWLQSNRPYFLQQLLTDPDLAYMLQ